ncbi:MAG: hypothetical protein GZ094_18655 [Mariniphaga sp.]|nr:hypothetical protein [Mariniphaga sp.]
MEKYIAIVFFFVLSFYLQAQTVENTSYMNQSGEKVLRIAIILPIDLTSTWQLFTTDDKLKKWIAPVAHIELKSGGSIVTNYDSTKTLLDSSSIHLPIIGYIEKELLVLKVLLNNHFPEGVRNTDQNLQEFIQFIKVDDNHTKIVSSMIGWGEGSDWDKTYNFFVKGNEWTYQELLKNYK